MAVSPKQRILLVDDDEEDYLIIKNIIGKITGKPFIVDWVVNVPEALEVIERAEHQLYLIDYRLGADDGFDVLRHFDLAERREPFIVLTGAGDEQIEQQAMELGAADYLVKGSFDAELLSRVLRYSIQRKLLEAQRIEQLRAISKSKDEFIALASHQLRTPATVVKQYLRMVLDGYAGDVNTEQRQFLDNAYISNERQIRIVDDILRVAQLDLDKVKLYIEQISLNDLVGSIVADVTSYATERHQQIFYEPLPSDIHFPVDEKYIRMAISNILDNASKYTPEGKTITVTVSKETKRIIITIQDTGVGIARADLPKLFMKFSRINNPLSIKVGGTGLGLYWANEIIRMHKGNIKVDSRLNQGTTFTICLPQN